MTTDVAALIEHAREVRARSYSPYSRFRVGAVVLTADGERHEGVNVENASYRMTTCAEQSAIAGMATRGQRGPIVAVAVVGDGPDPVTPCGGCRQTIYEFGPDAMVYSCGDGDEPLATHITELLPHGFGPDQLARARS
jgi:cytidine deaminase